MMPGLELGPHAAFIVGSYAAAALIVLALIGWVVLDHRAQAKQLRDLEARGISRRSARQAGKPS
jgi:heme exporter protein D